ncbi:hypothetical protein [Halorussus sp. MSC15.2]|uniref:hypothetical protein n=1 Tax=Halorussus sp. MSC15.2 TaxID=2283638 RepID=UPI0013D2A42F|nr:hypothetical protein [Halorussus sp. MSC15.2]NEU58782.1 hypothetical protein [Halorussus sp. MSC15.2]
MAYAQPDSETVYLETDVEQVLTGLQVGLGGAKGTCCWCGRELHDGHCVTVYAYRTAGHDEWSLPRVYCRDCNGGKIETPTLGTTGVVATAFLGILQVAASQTTRLVLTGVEIEEYSGPDDGSKA